MNELKILRKNISPSALIVGGAILLLIAFISKEQSQLQQEHDENQRLKSKKLEIQHFKNELIDTMNLSEKKREFLKIIVPPLDEVYEEELSYYNDIQLLIEENPDNEILERLQEEYNAKDNLELLMALKPHPKSITLAQAAMESAWGESRFFRKANNVFGVWSYNQNEPRIPASVMRGDKTIWLKKYPTIKAAIKDYYKILSRSWAFKEFRALNYQKENQNPYLLARKLQKYSERRELYTNELATMINNNRFTLFDEVMYEQIKTAKAPTKERLFLEEERLDYEVPMIKQKLNQESQELLGGANENTQQKEEK